MFPRIENISDMLPYISDCSEIRVIEKGAYTVINYVVVTADTFNAEKLSPEAYAMRKECRGIIFDTKSGRLIRRPYHKFFNLNEKPETMFSIVNMDEPHTIYDKLDGSMIAPFISNGKLYFGTKLGVTEASENAHNYAINKRNYRFFVGNMLDAGYTPIFEWCSPRQQIVIRYPKDMLVLTAVRDMYSGEYMSTDAMKRYADHDEIPVVSTKENTSSDLTSFVDNIKMLKDEEGVVIRFHSGHMLKIKAAEYLNIHRAKDTLHLEKNVLKIVLEDNEDDLIANLPPEDAAKLSEYSNAVKNNIRNLAVKLFEIYNKADKGTKKDYALYVLEYFKEYSAMLFKIYDGHDAYEVVRNYLLTHTSSGAKVDSVRDIIGTKWNETLNEDEE